MRKERCKASTIAGKRCKNGVSVDGEYCKIHKRSVNTCPCCFEDGGNLLVLKPCCHVIHRGECSDGLTSTKCPLCRVEVTNWPDAILDKIDRNESMYREERLLEEERNLLMSDDFMGGGMNMGTLILLGGRRDAPDIPTPQDMVALLRGLIRDILEHEVEDDVEDDESDDSS